jgi:hypothetical protein
MHMRDPDLAGFKKVGFAALYGTRKELMTSTKRAFAQIQHDGSVA